MQMGERRGRGRAAEEAPGPGSDCRVDCGATVRNEDRGGLLPVGRGEWGETAQASADFWSQSREELKKILFLMLVPLLQTGGCISLFLAVFSFPCRLFRNRMDYRLQSGDTLSSSKNYIPLLLQIPMPDLEILSENDLMNPVLLRVSVRFITSRTEAISFPVRIHHTYDETVEDDRAPEEPAAERMVHGADEDDAASVQEHVILYLPVAMLPIRLPP
ncbi:hypothetical protein MRB53_018582 [Persea americana]|uniref:Uncharacterized protein n=1 Tax=Persea americana TaxID=3435 RepID=A0ACC2M8H9_PERAE|nr:hypothetical protein MRB53_018582 [Persea americana]